MIRHELEPPLRQPIVARPRTAATRADWPTILPGKHLHFERWSPCAFHPSDFSVHKGLERFDPIEDSLQLHPVVTSGEMVGFATPSLTGNATGCTYFPSSDSRYTAFVWQNGVGLCWRATRQGIPTQGGDPMKPYNAEIRGEVLAACGTNEVRRAIALRLNVSESWLRRIQQQRRETGQIAPKTAAPRQPKWHAWADWLIAKIAARPDIYLRELQAELKRERGEDVCLGTICGACRRSSSREKKDADCQRAGSSRCCRDAHGMARFTGANRSRQSRFHRRNVGENQHGAA